MKRNILPINNLLIFVILFTSCSIQNRMTNDTIQKSIKTRSEEKRGEIFFENDFAIMYFSKEKVLEILETEQKSKDINSCNLERIENYIKLIEGERVEKQGFLNSYLIHPTQQVILRLISNVI